MDSARAAELADTSKLIIEQGSKSFAAAARLFDPETRRNAYMLYAWCRHCDDRIDNQELGFNIRPQTAAATHAVLGELREQTQAAIHDQPSSDPVFEGLRYVLKHNQIPGHYALEMLDGFAMDADEANYRSLDDTLKYCYYVAGVVGIMMAYVMGTREPAALQRATDLGIAFQLTNISRDVHEDAKVGRIYLPADWLRDAGIPAAEILKPQHADRLANVVARLLEQADRYYSSADAGLRALGFRSAWAVAAARDVYKAIGDTVRDRGVHAWRQRVVVPRRRKLVGVAAGMRDAARAALLERHQPPTPRDDDLWTAAQLHLSN